MCVCVCVQLCLTVSLRLYQDEEEGGELWQLMYEVRPAAQADLGLATQAPDEAQVHTLPLPFSLSMSWCVCVTL